MAIGHRDASSSMFQASFAWSSVVACCRNMWRGDLPKLGELQSQRSFFAACFVAGVEIQVLGHWMSVLMTKQSKTSLKVEFVRILFTEFQRHVRHVPLVSSYLVSQYFGHNSQQHSAPRSLQRWLRQTLENSC